jgi:hypothetical protein
MSSQLDAPEYVASFPAGSHVRIVREGRAHLQEVGTIIRILDNPTHNSKHQWYDIRLDGARVIRIREPFLTLEPERVVAS